MASRMKRSGLSLLSVLILLLALLPAGTAAAADLLPTTLTMAQPAAVQYSDSTYLTAQLRGPDGPVAWAAITFAIRDSGGATVDTATTMTDANGVAIYGYQANVPAGSYTVTASYAGDGTTYMPAPPASASLAVFQEDASITYTGPTYMSDSSLQLTAQVSESSDGSPGDITRAGQVRFSLRKPDGTPVGDWTATVSSGGTAAAVAYVPVGSYQVTTTLFPNGYYQAPQDTAIVRLRTQVTVSDQSAVTGSQTTLSAKLTAGGSSLAGQTLAFAVDGSTVGSVTTDANGVAMLQYSGTQGAGTYTIAASYAGSQWYGASTGSGTLVVTAQPTVLTLAPADTIQYSDGVTYRAALSANGQPLAGQTVSFSLNGAPAGSAITDQSGNAALPATVTNAAGTYPLQAQYAGNGTYIAAAAAANVTVIQEDATLAYTGDTTVGTDPVALSARLTEAQDSMPGDITRAGSVQFTVKRSDGTVAATRTADVVSGGTAAVIVSGLAPDQYTVVVSLLPNGYYTAAAVTQTLGPVVHPTHLSLTTTPSAPQYSDAVTYRANLTTNCSCEPVAGQTITFTVNGAPIGTATTDQYGNATLSATVADGGSYPFGAQYAGSIAYAPSSASRTLTVAAEDATLVYTGDTTVDDGPVNLSARLTEAQDGMPGDITRAGTVQFLVYHRYSSTLVATATAAVGAGGTAATTLSGLARDEYRVVIRLLPNGYYQAADVTQNLEPVPYATALAAADVTADVGTTPYLTATLTSGTAPLAGQSVTFFVDGMKVYAAMTDDTGVAVVPYNVSGGAGTRTITVTYDGELLYAASSASATLTVNPMSTAFAVTMGAAQYSDSATLSATLTGNGRPLSGKPVTFVLSDATLCTATTDATGTVACSFTVAQSRGAYSLQVQFAGDAYAAPATYSDSLAVNPEDATVQYTGATKVVGGTLALKAHVTQANDGAPGDITKAGPVQFVLTNAATGAVIGTYTAPVNAAGDAAITVSVSNKVQMNVTVSLTSQYYQAPSVTTALR